MAYRAALLWLAIVLGVAACSPVVVTGTRENFDAYHRGALARRASFDLACPETELTFTPLGDRELDGGDYTTVGVSGCGKRVSYVRQGGQWVGYAAMSDDGSAAAPGEKQGVGTSKTAQELTTYVMKSPEVKVLIEPRKADGPGFGGSNLSMDGKPVWPPSGAACEVLVACCEQHLAADKRFELLCPFAIVRARGDCTSALATVNQIGAELGRPREGACKPQ
jgi:hypothetical protein